MGGEPNQTGSMMYRLDGQVAVWRYAENGGIGAAIGTYGDNSLHGQRDRAEIAVANGNSMTRKICIRSGHVAVRGMPGVPMGSGGARRWAGGV